MKIEKGIVENKDN